MRACNRRSSQGRLTPGHLCFSVFSQHFCAITSDKGWNAAAEEVLLGQLAGTVWFCAAKLCTFSVTSRRRVMAIPNDKELCFLPLSTCVFFLCFSKTPARVSFWLKPSALFSPSKRRVGCSINKMRKELSADWSRVHATILLCTVHIFCWNLTKCTTCVCPWACADTVACVGTFVQNFRRRVACFVNQSLINLSSNRQVSFFLYVYF